MQGGQPSQPSGTNRPGGLAFISSSNDCKAHISVTRRFVLQPSAEALIDTRTAIFPRPLPIGASPRTRSAGDYGARATPVPIPNTVVKPRRADGTAGEARWESTSSPASSGECPSSDFRRRAFSFLGSARGTATDDHDHDHERERTISISTSTTISTTSGERTISISISTTIDHPCR